jgi:amino acid transporter
MATAVVVGTVIGSGVFQKPQQVAAVTYPGVVLLVWVLGGLLVLLGALAYAEVATLYPRAGGNYVFLREAYGRPFGFLWGWVEFFMIRGASLAALATMFTTSMAALLVELSPAWDSRLGYWERRLVTVAVIGVLALVNIRGVRWGGGLNLFVTLIKVGSLLFFITLPFLAVWLVAPGTPGADPGAADVAKLSPAWPAREELDLGYLRKFATALLAVLWAYHGWMNIAPVAEEVKDPQRNIPVSLLAGTVILIGLYVGTNVAYSSVLTQAEMRQMKEAGPGEEPAKDRTVAIGYCRRLLGPVGLTLAAAAVMISVFGALNGNLLVGPRLLYAMSADRLAPRWLGEVHARYRTPALAIAVMAGWAVLLVLGEAALRQGGVLRADQDAFDALTNFAMFGAVIFETLAVVSIFVFRWKRPDAPRPYRCWGYPVVPALYVILPVLILWNMFEQHVQEALIGVGFIAVGAVVYCLYGTRRPWQAG